MSISANDIRMLCAQREVDLVLISARSPYEICLRGTRDYEGDFFSILATDIEYIELAPGITVGDIRLTNVADLPNLGSKWMPLQRLYSGPCIAIRSAYADTWESAQPTELFVMVANTIVFEAGSDWLAAVGYR
jgi:hypothetical protein